MRSFKVFSGLAILAMVAAACSSPAATTQAPATSAPAAPAVTEAPAAATEAPATTLPATAASTVSAISGTPSGTEAATAMVGGGAAAPVVQVPPEKLVQKNHLLICTDFPYPPQEFFDENGNPQGLDIDIGTEIGKRLGLQVQFVNSVFDTIIAAVTSGKCDIIISAQNITADRQKQVSMIPYFQAGQAFVVQKGNPKNVQQATDLCGQSVAAESGTTQVDYLQGTGDYNGKGLTQECDTQGKKLTVVVTQKDSDALQQLQAGKVAAYATDSPVAGYYSLQSPEQFEVAHQIIDPAIEGISVPCGQQDCTSAPLSEVGVSVKSALKSMMDDGTYATILKKWNLSDGAVTLQ